MNRFARLASLLVIGCGVAVACKSSGTDEAPKPSSTDGPTSGPSSADKIADAEAAGTIDHDTALLYRVYVLYDRASLPPEYLGFDDQGPWEGTLLFGEIAERWSAMSASVRDRIDPFMRRPTDPVSFWAKHLAATASTSSTLTIKGGDPAAGWDFVDDPAAKLRVWFRPGGGPLAKQILDDYTAKDGWGLSKQTMLGREPCSDDALRNTLGQPNNGGSPALDVYLTPGYVQRPARSFASDDLVKESPVGVTLPLPPSIGADDPCPGRTPIVLIDPQSRSADDAPSPDPNYLRSALVHEVFHAFQYAFVGGRDQSNGWFMESSATWSQDLVFPGDNYEHAYIKVAKDPKTGEPVRPTWNSAATGPLYSLAATDAYSAYLFPFYLTRGKGKDKELIGGFWNGAAPGKDVLQVMHDMPAWKELFSEYLTWNVNEDILLKYADQGVDKLPLDPLNDNGLQRQAVMPDGNPTIALAKLPPASGTYIAFDTFNAPKTLEFDLSSLNQPNLTVHALLQRSKADLSRDWVLEDWTGEDQKKLCNTDPGGLPASTVLIIANTGIAIPETVRNAKVSVHGGTVACAEGNGILSYSGTMTVDADDPMRGTGTFTYSEKFDSTLKVVLSNRDETTGYITYDVTGTHAIDASGGGTAKVSKSGYSSTETDRVSAAATVHTPAEKGEYWPWTGSDPAQKWTLTLRRDTGEYEFSILAPAAALHRVSSTHTEVDCGAAGTTINDTVWDDAHHSFGSTSNDCITGTSSTPAVDAPQPFASWSSIGDEVLTGPVPATGPIDVTVSKTVDCADLPSTAYVIGGYGDYMETTPKCSVTYTAHFRFDPSDRW